jgi:hypothetical protein
MFKKFGVKVNFDKYDRAQLENFRNLLRTKLHQTETSNNFNALLSNESYQKDKFMVNLLTTRIKEMLGEGKMPMKTVNGKKVPAFAADGKGKNDLSKNKKTKEGLDPVGKEDDDVNNDGKKNKSDDYLTKRRAAVAKAIASKKGTKVKEGKASAAEMAHHHACEYAKHHKMGNLEMAQHHRDACESCGGKLSHGSMGEAFHSHQGMNNGQAYKCDEGVVGGVIGGVAGAALGGPLGAMTGYAAGSKAGDDLASESRNVGEAKAKCCCEEKGKAKCPVHKPMNEAERTMSRAAKGMMKYGKDGMKALAKAGKDGKDLDKVRDKYNKYDEELTGNQSKIDLNDNGKVDGDDLAKLRAGKKKSMKKVKEGITESIARYIAEDEEGKAKSITAGLDMVNDFTSWMQRIATYQTKSMIELSDEIRAHFGDAEAQSFKQETYTALEQSLSALTQSREQLSNAVSVLAGEAPMQEPMGSDPMANSDDMGMEEPGMEEPEALPAPDEFASADAAAGGPETTGRMKRESIERGNRLMKILGA